MKTRVYLRYFAHDCRLLLVHFKSTNVFLQFLTKSLLFTTLVNSVMLIDRYIEMGRASLEQVKKNMRERRSQISNFKQTDSLNEPECSLSILNCRGTFSFHVSLNVLIKKQIT